MVAEVCSIMILFSYDRYSSHAQYPSSVNKLLASQRIVSLKYFKTTIESHYTEELHTDFITDCPGFGQDRVNFHQKPGGDTAGLPDLIPVNVTNVTCSGCR